MSSDHSDYDSSGINSSDMYDGMPIYSSYESSSSQLTDYNSSEEEEDYEEEEKNIPEDRKIHLISDVDSVVPDRIRKLFSLIDEIIETNKETVSSIYEKIEKSEEPIDFLYAVIKHALKIRSLNAESLRSLRSLLLQKHKCKNASYIRETEIRNYTNKDNDLLIIFQHDDLEAFIKKSSEIGFNPKTKVSLDYSSPLSFVKSNIWHMTSYLQIMAFYGSIKCFKHAVLSNEYHFYDINEFAVAGGNMEIIHILEQRNASFETCLSISIKFHRNELSNWILIHYKCLESSLINACQYFNLRACIFEVINEIKNRTLLSQAAQNGHLEFVKYLYETYHISGTGFEIDDASKSGSLDVIKYLYESCNCKATKFAVNNASKEGHLDIIKYLYETCHLDAEAKDIFGSSPIRIAIENGNLEIVKYLCETCHVSVKTKYNNELSLISSASLNGQLEVVKYLYETCHANVENDAIIYASLNGHLEIVKYLYETCHANVEAKDNYERTPINAASENGQLEVVKYLRETCHADVETKDINGNTPIDNASIVDHLDVVKYLYEVCHAEITESTIKYSKTEKISEYFSSILADKPTDFESDFCKACEEGKLTSVQYLYDKWHTNIDQKCMHGHALMYKVIINNQLDIVKYLHETCHVKMPDEAIGQATVYGNLEIVKYLYEILHMEIPDEAICQASANGHLNVIKYLYETCHIEIPDEAIVRASKKGHLEVVKYLYETCHIDPETKDFYGWTPIDKASYKGHLEVVKYLYETCKAEITKSTISNATYIEIKEYFNSILADKPSDFESNICKACEEGKITSVKYLYDKWHTNIDKRDINGYTPIDNAVMNGHFDIVKYLHECGSNAPVCEAIKQASENGYTEIVKYIYEVYYAKYFNNIR